MKSDCDCLRCREASLAEDEFHVCGLLDFCLTAIAEFIDDIAFSLADFLQVNADWSGMHSIVRCPARQVGHAPTCNHRLSRSASFIHASAAHMLPLNQRGPHARFSQRRGKRRTRLSSTDNDGVVLLWSCHSRSLKAKPCEVRYWDAFLKSRGEE